MDLPTTEILEESSRQLDEQWEALYEESRLIEDQAQRLMKKEEMLNELQFEIDHTKDLVLKDMERQNPLHPCLTPSFDIGTINDPMTICAPSIPQEALNYRIGPPRLDWDDVNNRGSARLTIYNKLSHQGQTVAFALSEAEILNMTHWTKNELKEFFCEDLADKLFNNIIPMVKNEHART